MGIFENTPQEKMGRANSITLQRITQTPNKFVNNRAQAIAQRKLQEKINESSGQINIQKKESQQVVQRAKAVKVLIDSDVSGSNVVKAIQVNTASLRNHWNSLSDQLGKKKYSADVDRHILPMEIMAADVARELEGENLKTVIGLSATKTIKYIDASAQIEKEVAKKIRKKNNEVWDDYCWHFWGSSEENSFRNNYISTKFKELREAIKNKKKKRIINELREAIVFTWFDTPTYVMKSRVGEQWSPKYYDQMAAYFNKQIKDHVASLEEFKGWAIPSDIMNRTPKKVWEDWKDDDDAVFYKEGMTEFTYSNTKKRKRSKIVENREEGKTY